MPGCYNEKVSSYRLEFCSLTYSVGWTGTTLDLADGFSQCIPSTPIRTERIEPLALEYRPMLPPVSFRLAEILVLPENL